MYRASTPTHTFSLPVMVENLEDVLITYKQGADIILEKELDDCTAEENILSYTLTQAETKLFHKGNVVIQIRVKTKQGKVIPSEPIYRTIYDVLNDEVM